VGGVQQLLLAGAGVLAGVCGAVAGLASLVSFPALLASGLTPVAANVTNTVALVLSTVGSSAASGPELRGQGGRLRRLLVLALAGGLAGAALLLLTPAEVFGKVVPVLIALGSVLLLRRPATVRPGGATPGAVNAVLVFAVAVYGGYFGAGAGILMLAVLALSIPESLARLNALKNVSLGVANAVAATAFALFGPVRWGAALPLAAGFLAGGALGPALVRRLPETPLRVTVALAGLGLAAKLGVDAYARS
jgi:uncharacterized protein